jgi:hypothetical protein
VLIRNDAVERRVRSDILPRRFDQGASCGTGGVLGELSPEASTTQDQRSMIG